MMSAKYFSLNNGIQIPAVGLGTFRIRGKDLIYSVIDSALASGYRLFDTAAVYGNEADIGSALRVLLPKHGITRKQIFITTKLSPSDHGGGEKTKQAFFKSLDLLQTEYIDLFLIHWPGVSGVTVGNQTNAQLRNQSWLALVELHKQGVIKAIGVSNYTVRHLTELLSTSDVVPAVNQVEWHPHYYQPELKSFCQHHNILIQAYSSLGTSESTSLIIDPVVVGVAKKLNVSPARVLLRWALQQEIAVIPKARSSEHIADNINLNFIIPNDDMESLNKLGKISHKYAWNPDTVA